MTDQHTTRGQESLGESSRPQTRQQTRVGTTIIRIEAVFEAIFDDLRQANQLHIQFSNRRGSQNTAEYDATNSIHFPGRSNQEALKFARVLLILQLSHGALINGTILTKRHIFYQHQDLFKKQSVVDDLVDDIAYNLDLTREDLNIVASAKGVVAGPLIIDLTDDTVLDATIGDSGTPIPSSRSIAGLRIIPSCTLNWVLVIEKDATFRALSSSLFWRTAICGPGLLVTAKGYPDLSTLLFLQSFQESFPKVPIFALVDLDPDGMNIFRCYRYGSDGMAHGTDFRGLETTWIGIKIQHILNLGVSVGIEHQSETLNDQSFSTSHNPKVSMSSTQCKDPIPYLSARDRRHAIGTIRKLSDLINEDVQALQLLQELQALLVLGVKAEIQWVDEAGSITNWLDNELRNALLSKH